MIYQKASPKTAFVVRLTNENYDFICKAAGEFSLAAYLNKLVEKARKSDIEPCNFPKSHPRIESNA